MFEPVNLKKNKSKPKDYHCNCKFCKQYMGLLIKENGALYSKTERRKYYDKEAEKNHVAKTPLHIARWAVQTYTKKNDWVLDPTMGAGTTAVEALIQGRNTAGIELQYKTVIDANCEINNPFNKKHIIKQGTALDLKKYFKRKFDLVINNPPYSGDEHVGAGSKYKDKRPAYDRELQQNFAFLKENEDYWNIFIDVYQQCFDRMKSGAVFIIGVKDMIRHQKPYLLHKYFGDILSTMFNYEGMVLLPHWPPTLFMSTYNKRFPGVKVPRYQTILIFRKP